MGDSSVIDRKVAENIEDLKQMKKTVELSKSILDATNDYMQKYNFVGNSENYYLPDNSFINKVLDSKKGIPISLSLMYLCILSRLGVHCEPINFPRHFLLRWLEHPELSSTEMYTYIDVYNRGKRLNSFQARQLIGSELLNSDNIFLVATPIDAGKRMLRNLISIGASHSNNTRDSSYSLLRSALEFMLLINDEEVPDYSFMLSRVYLQLNINHQEIEKLLGGYAQTPGLSQQVEYLLETCQMQKEEERFEMKDITPKRRNEAFPCGDVRYHVGMVAEHKKYHYKCVIYGWDSRCTASRRWIQEMGVDRLARKDKQPFYNVLVEDGSNRYAADENLTRCEPEEIPHSEVGKSFKEFLPSYGYVSNTELRTEYPDDLKEQGEK